MTFVTKSKEFGFDRIRQNRWKGSIGSIAGNDAVGLDPLIFAGAAPACLVEQTGRCVLLNKALAAMIGLPPGQIEGRPITNFFPFSGPALDRWFAFAKIGSPLPDRQFTWGGRHYQVVVQPIHNVALGFDGLFMTAFDVTRHVRITRRLRASHRRLAALAHLDDLTGLLNRRGLELQLRRGITRLILGQQPFSLLMIDIDDFKAYNDRCGHLQGDACLRQVSAVLRRSLRRSGDIAGRFGGEEFVIALPDVDEGSAILVAERLRAGVESLRLHHPATDAGHITISVGIASLQNGQNCVSIECCHAALMQAADAALYQAKAAGRNRVESNAAKLDGNA